MNARIGAGAFRVGRKVSLPPLATEYLHLAAWNKLEDAPTASHVPPRGRPAVTHGLSGGFPIGNACVRGAPNRSWERVRKRWGSRG